MMCSGILEASQHTVPYNTFLQCKKLLWRPVCVRVCVSQESIKPQRKQEESQDQTLKLDMPTGAKRPLQ